MTWTKLDDGFLDRPAVLDVEYVDRMLYVEGLIYCNRALTDGYIPARALGRVTSGHPEPTAGADRLVKAGLWTAEPDGWAVVDFHEHQRSRDDVEADRERNRQRQERFRRHGRGDHSMCDRNWCPALRNAVTNGVSNGVSNAVSNGAPSRPVPTRPDPKEGTGREGTAATGSGAPEGAPLAPPQPAKEGPCDHGTYPRTSCALCRQQADPRPTLTVHGRPLVPDVRLRLPDGTWRGES